MKYSTFAINNDLEDNEVLFFTTHGVDKVLFDDVQEYFENMSVSYGEEGQSWNTLMAITTQSVYHGDEQISKAFEYLDE